MLLLAQGGVVLATDVGLWMSLPAFGPAFVVVGVVIWVMRRDRRRNRGSGGRVEETWEPGGEVR